MKIRSHQAFANPVEIEATSVLIVDDFDNPIVVAVQTAPGHMVYATIDHPDFNEILKNFGFSRRIILTGSNEKPLKDVSWNGT